MTSCAVGGPRIGAARAARSGRAAGVLRIEPIGASAFPLEGDAASFAVPDGTRFFERDDAGRLFHLAPRGGRLPEATYQDANSLLYVPERFRAVERAAIVLFLHGNLATLSRDVARRQRVPAQIEKSGKNLLLVAPQFAMDALDSSAGNFWTQGFLDRYLEAAADRLAVMPGVDLAAGTIRQLPVIVVAYSGGYLPAAFSLSYAQDHSPDHIAGVILLDALFGEEAKFARWIEAEHARTFFVSVYAKGSANLNGKLQSDIGRLGIERTLPGDIGPGTVAFEEAPNAVHNDFVTRAHRSDPLADVLSRIDLSRLAEASR